VTQDDVWAEIDLRSISHNIKEIRSLISPGARLMAVLKANAYGHGIAEVAGRVLAGGAQALGVARIGEAIRLREAGCVAPILIFGRTSPEMADTLIRYRLIQSLWSLESARALSDAASAMNRKIAAHLKVDTGMGRLGIVPCDLCHPFKNIRISPAALREAADIKRLPGIDLEGAYTHFATADAVDKSLARRQFEIFQKFLLELKGQGIEFSVRHAANSAAIIDMPETHLDMVRAGISIYGYYPSEAVNRHKISLRPAMTVMSRIIHVKSVDSGFAVSYGGVGRTTRPTRIATVSIGYADGYSRQLSSRGHMLVRGRAAPVIGRVCMDQTMLDVGDIPDAEAGDEVVAFGLHETLSVGADNIAKLIHTISYEILTSVSDRVPRIYVR